MLVMGNTPRISERWLWLGLLAFFVVTSIPYALKIKEDDHKSAILRWRNQLQSMQDGEDIYDRHVYPNPPIMALILIPIVNWPESVGLPPQAAALGWFALKALMAMFVFRWVFTMLETPQNPFPLWAKALTVLLSLRPIAGDLSHGNVNLFILFLVTAALYCWHNKRDFWGGVLLALAISCKVTPALFVPYLIWKRAWTALAGVAIGMALFFWPGLIPALCLGWDGHAQQLESWIRGMVRPFLVEGVVWSEHNNQSIPGLVYRLTTHSPSFSTYVDHVYTPTRYDNLFDWGIPAARWCIKGCMALFVGLIVWTCKPRWKPMEGESVSVPRMAEYSLIVLGMLLFSERTWKHHCVTLVLPFAVLCYYLARGWAETRLRNGLIAMLVMVFLLMSSTSTSLLGRDGGKLAQVYGAYVFAYLLLVATLAFVLKRKAKVMVEAPSLLPEIPALPAHAT